MRKEELGPSPELLIWSRVQQRLLVQRGSERAQQEPKEEVSLRWSRVQQRLLGQRGPERVQQEPELMSLCSWVPQRGSEPA